MPAGEAPAAAAGEVDEGSNERPSLGSFGADAAPPGSPKLKKREGRGAAPGFVQEPNCRVHRQDQRLQPKPKEGERIAVGPIAGS